MNPRDILLYSDSYCAPNIKLEVGGVWNTACDSTLIFYSMYGPVGGLVPLLLGAAEVTKTLHLDDGVTCASTHQSFQYLHCEVGRV